MFFFKKQFGSDSIGNLIQQVKHDESEPDTNRRLQTPGLQRETFRVVLFLELLLALAKSQNPKEAAAANVHK